MNRQEREEWEILCRQYNVDSLQEAIQGCREELEFLIHCAERLEPRTEEEETPFNISSPRRFYTPGNAVLGMQETPFLHAETKEQTVFLTEYNFINVYQYQVWKIGDLSKKIPTTWSRTMDGC
nr:molecular chaperone DnaJ [Bacteroides finegoldii]